MDSKRRMEATAAIWGPISFAMFGLFLSGGIADGLTIIHLIIAIVLAVAGLVGTGMLWNWGTVGMFTEMNVADKQHEKPKRDHIEKALKDLSTLSDEELMILKQRLSTGEINDDMLHQYLVSDDGELVQYK